MSNSTLHKQMGRVTFLAFIVLVVAFCGGALYLTHTQGESRHLLFAAAYSIVLLGVFWIRSLECCILDMGWPRWSFWPCFIVIFTACFGAHVLKIMDAPETLALFIALQIPLAVWPAKPAAVDLSKSPPSRAARNVTPIDALEFAVYVVLIAGLLHVLHLLRMDVSGVVHSRVLKLALDFASALLCVLWILSARGRLRALGQMRWTLVFCSIVLIPCLLIFALRVISFPHALILFVALQIPAVLIRRESSVGRFFLIDKDS
ncbi:MAG: hypothetical protein WAK26_07945 [Terracidiphilus sp.]